MSRKFIDEAWPPSWQLVYLDLLLRLLCLRLSQKIRYGGGGRGHLCAETCVPVILSKRAVRLGKETGNQNIVVQSDLQRKSFKYAVTVVMTRSFRTFFRGLIVSTIYLIFLLWNLLEVYPIIFQGPNSIYKYPPGIAGLTFIPKLGAVITVGIAHLCDTPLSRARECGANWSPTRRIQKTPSGTLQRTFACVLNFLACCSV